MKQYLVTYGDNWNTVIRAEDKIHAISKTNSFFAYNGRQTVKPLKAYEITEHVQT